MAKQWLNSMYFRGSRMYDPVSRKTIPLRNDALIFTVKDTETLKTELKIIPNPTIDFYLAKKEQPYHKFSMPLSEVRKVTVKFTDRDREIAECLGRLPDFYNTRKPGSDQRAYRQMIMRNPNLYSADTNLEDFYKTKTVLANEIDGNQAVSPRYNMCFSDTEVDISNFPESFPDPNIAPCPINLITNIYSETKEVLTYILYDQRVKEDQQWVMSNPQEFIKEYIDPMVINEGLVIKLKLFYKEDELIRTYFSDMHERKPDFCAWWNMSFDMPTILNRLKRLGYNEQQIAQIICHPDVPDQYKYVKYIPDPKRELFDMSGEEDDDESEGEETSGDEKKSKGKPHPSRLVDWMEAPGYTQHYCQMAMFSNMNKRFLLPSYKLDAVASEFGSIGKLDLSSYGLNIKDANVKDFKRFLAYNIRDSFAQYMLEQKQQTLSMCIISTSNSRLASYNQASVIIKNEIMLYLIHNDEVMGNAITYQPESFAGALVGKPELIEQFGIKMGGVENGYVFEDSIDADASSLYPSLMITFNIFKSCLFGRIVDSYRIDNSGKSKEKQFGKADGLMAKIECIDQALFDICEEYLGLPGPEKFIKMIETSC